MVYVEEFESWEKSVPALLESAKFAEIFKTSGKERILVKPNLVSTDPPPITTPVELVDAIIDFISENLPGVQAAVGEGCGMMDYETDKVFQTLGYTEMAAEKGVELIDLNHAELVSLSDDSCTRWPEMHLPKIIMESFLFSVPVLKAHSFSTVTLTMKNMLGAAPPEYFCAGSWKKSAFHDRIEEAIFDLNKYRTPDFTLLDATEGMAQAHLWGPKCSPPPNRLAASPDPVAIDAWGAELLGFDWRKIGHISMADKEGLSGNSMI